MCPAKPRISLCLKILRFLEYQLCTANVLHHILLICLRSFVLEVALATLTITMAFWLLKPLKQGHRYHKLRNAFFLFLDFYKHGNTACSNVSMFFFFFFFFFFFVVFFWTIQNEYLPIQKDGIWCGCCATDCMLKIWPNHTTTLLPTLFDCLEVSSVARFWAFSERLMPWIARQWSG